MEGRRCVLDRVRGAGHRLLLRALVVRKGAHQLHLLALPVSHDPLAALLEEVQRLAVLFYKCKDRG